MTQAMNLLNLPSQTQSEILLGQMPTAERDLRSLITVAVWL